MAGTTGSSPSANQDGARDRSRSAHAASPVLAASDVAEGEFHDARDSLPGSGSGGTGSPGRSRESQPLSEETDLRAHVDATRREVMAAIASIQSSVTALSRTFASHAEGIDRQVEARMHRVESRVEDHGNIL
eukprot:8762004-Pyramimonas_sp.AAC.1